MKRAQQVNGEGQKIDLALEFPQLWYARKKDVQHLKHSLLLSSFPLVPSLCCKQVEHALKGDSPLSLFQGSVPISL